MTPSGHPNSAQHLKKVVYAVGLPSAISVSLGWLFLMLHWPGGSELFNYGLLVFLLVFVPLLGIDRYHVGTRRMPEKGSMIRSEEHTSELQSRENLVCRLLL